MVNDNNNDTEAQDAATTAAADGAAADSAGSESGAKRVRRRAAGRPAGPPPGSEGAAAEPIVVPAVPAAPAEVAVPLAGEVKVVEPPSRRRRATRPTDHRSGSARSRDRERAEGTLPGLDAEDVLEAAEEEVVADDVLSVAALTEEDAVAVEVHGASRRSRSARRPSAAAGAAIDPAEADEPPAVSSRLIGRGGAADPADGHLPGARPRGRTGSPVPAPRRRGAAG